MNLVIPYADRLPPGRDVALAGSLLVVSVLSGLYIDAARPNTVEPSSWWHWALICSPALLVAFRRINPTLVVLLGTAAQTAIWVSNLPEVLLPVIVILYTAASEAGRNGVRAAVASSVVLTAVTAVGIRIAADVTVYQLPLVALTCGTAIVLGVNAARQRTMAGELATAATQARLKAVHERAEAIAQERTHIGRELHDIVGHALSVIAVRAEAADRVAGNQPDAARSAVADIATAARSALSDTRRVLGGLQRSSAAELAPPRDLTATCQLIEQLAATGVDVTVQQSGCGDHPPSPVVAGGAYRIVQESLTNAIKHGGHNTTITATIECKPDEVSILITNTTDKGSSGPESTGGTGLAGMAERVHVLGGSFDAGLQPNAMYAVSARLPNRPPHGDTER